MAYYEDDPDEIERKYEALLRAPNEPPPEMKTDAIDRANLANQMAKISAKFGTIGGQQVKTEGLDDYVRGVTQEENARHQNRLAAHKSGQDERSRQKEMYEFILKQKQTRDLAGMKQKDEPKKDEWRSVGQVDENGHLIFANEAGETKAGPKLGVKPANPMAVQLSPYQQQQLQNQNQELQVPGFELGKEVRPTSKEAQDSRNASAEMKTLNQLLDQYRAKMQNFDRLKPVGKQAEEIDSLVTSITITSKNLYELGALAGPDVAVIQQQIRPTRSLRNYATSNDAIISGLDTTKKNLNQSFQNKMSQRGYSMKPGSDFIQSPPKEEDAYPIGTMGISPEGTKVRYIGNDEWEEVE